MKTSNKVFFVGGILLLIVLTAGFGYRSIGGTRRHTSERSFSGSYTRGFHSDLHRKDASEFIFWRMDKTAAELRLNAAQKIKYDELKNSIQPLLSKEFGGHQRLEEGLRTELNKETADLRGLIEAYKAEMNALAGSLNKTLDRLADFHDSLDSVQKQILRDAVTAVLPYRHS